MNPMLACRGIDLTPGEGFLILSMLAAWLFAFIAVFANIIFILVAKSGGGFKKIHMSIVVAYFVAVGLLYFLCTGGYSPNAAHRSATTAIIMQWCVGILVFAIPALVLAHFVYLFRNYHRSKRKSAELSQEFRAPEINL